MDDPPRGSGWVSRKQHMDMLLFMTDEKNKAARWAFFTGFLWGLFLAFLVCRVAILVVYGQ